MEHLNLQKKFEDKFLSYLAVESQSNKSAEGVPSSPGQWKLARILEGELKELGLKEVFVNDFCVVQGYLPKRLRDNKRDVASIGWVCHLDTVDVSLSGEIHPFIVRNYQGGNVCQNKEKQIFIEEKNHPELAAYIGEDIIFSDGTSVLGADNKAAIANVMTVLEVLKENEELEHGDIYIAFVPDEEIGLKGARKIDFDRFKVDYAYTIDCCALGEVVYETFNAGSARLFIKGVTAHPMASKNNLVNPVLVANDFINLLDRGQTPEYTEGREGYIWVNNIVADVLTARVNFNIRDHSKDGYEAKKTYLKEALKIIKLKHPKAELRLEVEDVYGNIKDAVTDNNRACIDNIYKAFEELNIEPKTLAMRGGTDGSFISTQGILTPNYFTGAHNFHATSEFLPLKSAVKSCLVTLKLIELAVR